MPVHQQRLTALVEHEGHSTSWHSGDVLCESHAVGQFDINGGQSDVSVLINQAFAMNSPLGSAHKSKVAMSTSSGSEQQRHAVTFAEARADPRGGGRARWGRRVRAATAN
ncbi:hypothetical protein GCM10023319_35180 [Nocardia iowensis]